MIRLLRTQTGEISFILEGALTSLRNTLCNGYQFPTYRRLFESAGLNESTLRSDALRAFAQLRPSSKEDYISLQKDSLLRIQGRQFATDWTTGSTANAVLRISSSSDEKAEAEAVRRAFRAAGIARDDRVVLVDVGASDIYLFYGRVLAALGVFGPCFVKTSFQQEFAAEAIAHLKPTIIISVPTVLGRCLADLARRKIKLPEWKLRKVIYIGEAMNSRLKAEIRRKLGAKCFSFYGTTEVGSVGIECEDSKGIHIPLDLLWPTLLPYDGGAVRRVGSKLYEGVAAWTSLRYRDHPVIKYCVGDLVRIDLRTCRCGNPFPTMHFQRRLDHSLSLFGTKFNYDMFLNSIQAAIGIAASLEIHVELSNSSRPSRRPSKITFVLADCYRPYTKRCKAKIMTIHAIEDFVERGLLQLSFQFVPVTYFHGRKTRRIVMKRLQ